MKPNRILVLALSSALSLSGAAWARGVPSKPIQHSVRKSANLESAKLDIELAWRKINAAWRDKEFDPEGHAQKAKDLINQAYQELKLATAPAATEPASEVPADKK